MSPMLIVLALTWCALTRDGGLANIALGGVLGWLALRFVGVETTPMRRALRRVPAAVSLGLYFIWEIVLSNMRMALLMLRPVHQLRPAILAVPVQAESSAEVALLSNLMTLTPGTLGLDVSDDGKTLYVHVMIADDADAVRVDLQEGLVRRVRRLYAC